MKRKLLLIVASLLVGSMMYAQDMHWTWTDTDVHAYQTNMHITGRAYLDGELVTDRGDIEVAAFVGDQLRGTKMLVNVYPSSTLGYFVWTNCFYTVEGETFTFKAFDHASGIEYDLCPTQLVGQQSGHGSIDDPVLMYFTRSEEPISYPEHPWVPSTIYSGEGMMVTAQIQINGQLVDRATYEVGAFCGDECRGSEMLTYYEGLNRYMVFMTLYGQSGHVLSFRLYDHATQRELELTPPESMSFVPNAIVGAIQAPYVFSFSCGMGVITTTVVPEEGGAVTGGGAYWIGETCTLRAVANEGYTFVDWTENGQQVSTEPTLSIFVMESHDLQANFSVNSYEVSVEAQPEEGGAVAGTGIYDYGTTVTISATPNEHYEFVNWTEDGVLVSNSDEYAFAVNRSRHLVANFAHESFTVSATVLPANAGGKKLC